ncbi:MAG: N-acetylmuramoyl-L-alanine amidase family protein [Mycobacterium leprae]
MAAAKVIWDPGHGGRDPGALSHSGLMEKRLTLDLAQRIARLEPGFGGRVRFHFTHRADVDLAPQGEPYQEAEDLKARSDFANRIRRSLDREDRLFVALHAGHGLSVWRYPTAPRGDVLARSLLTQAKRQVEPWLRVAGAGEYVANHWVLRACRMPAAQVEIGDLAADGDAAQLGNPVVRQHLADGLVLGVAAYLSEPYRFVSDSGYDYEHFDWAQPSGATVAELDRLLAGTAMAGLASAFVAAEEAHGVHAVGLCALVAWSTDWGQAVTDRDGLAPLVRQTAERLTADYLNPKGRYYYGSNLIGMNVCYCADPRWQHGIANCWERLRPFGSRYGSQGRA